MFFEELVSLLGKNGVAIHDVNITETGEVKIDIDFSEHDKVFEDKIAKLEKENKALNSYLVQREQDSTDMIMKLKQEKSDKNEKIAELACENESLKQRIAELESKETEKPTKINLNDQIKVKLTPIGAEIYYHQCDEVNKQIKENGGTELEPMMPQIDKDGYTEFQLHHFISLYGEHIGMCKPNVIEPLDIIIAE